MKIKVALLALACAACAPPPVGADAGPPPPDDCGFCIPTDEGNTIWFPCDPEVDGNVTCPETRASIDLNDIAGGGAALSEIDDECSACRPCIDGHEDDGYAAVAGGDVDDNCDPI